MKLKASLIALASLLTVLSGCADNVRQDPFAEMKAVEASPVKDLSAVMALSKNTIAAMPYMKRYRGLGASDAGGSLFVKLATVLRRNFKSIVKVDSVEQTKGVAADVVVLLDVFSKSNSGLSATSTADISAIVIDKEGREIDVVKGHHSVSGWAHPTGAAAMSALVEGAMVDFERALMASTKLADFARARASAEPASVPAARPREKPALTPSFSSGERLEDFAVIIGIENYADLPDATYAERDAAAAKRFVLALGLPERNIALLTGTRATKNGFEKTLEGWLPNNATKNSRIFVFYSGHGAPDPGNGNAYLVPVDGDPRYLAQTGYPLKRLYASLGRLKAKSVLVALDSCFSGAGGRSVLAKGIRPLVGKVDTASEEGGSLSVISASASDQISGTSDETGYGLFTYNFLKGLDGAAKDGRGRITLKSLFGYVKPRVQDDAARANREQTPQLQSGGEDVMLR